MVMLKILRRRRIMREHIEKLRVMQREILLNWAAIVPMHEILEIYFNSIHVERSVWMKPRSDHFWSHIVLCMYEEAEWIESFRMCKETFTSLCLLLQPALEPRPVFLKSREPLSVEKQVAVALYKLGSCAEYRVVGNLFGIHKTTVQKCVYRVVSAINDIMMESYIRMPNVAEATQIALEFERISHIPQIIGCIDGTHVPILAPSEGYRDFVNRKGWASYILQAVVDSKCRFINIFIRYPGSNHDAAVLKGSSLFKNAVNVIPQATRNVNGLEIPFLIIGDPAYPLSEWLMKGYPGSVRPEEESFNVHLNSARVNVEMAFGRLKGRWRILLKRIDVHYQFVPQIISACCILQNFLESKEEQFSQQWLHNVSEAEELFPQPVSTTNRRHEDLTGSIIRQHLTDYLCNNFPLRRRLLK